MVPLDRMAVINTGYEKFMVMFRYSSICSIAYVHQVSTIVPKLRTMLSVKSGVLLEAKISSGGVRVLLSEMILSLSPHSMRTHCVYRENIIRPFYTCLNMCVTNNLNTCHCTIDITSCTYKTQCSL